MLNQKLFNKSIREFEKIESRTNFFTLATKLIKKGFEIEGYLLILTTWNFASFRYATKVFDIEEFKKTISEIQRPLMKFQFKNFRTINFENYEEEIINIYDSLSVIKGIEHTGASKLMHLANPKVFVIWDGYIRGEKTKRFYKIYKTKIWERGKYEKSSLGYIRFLKDMQKYYKEIKLKSSGRTFAKAIDECNYVNITIPIQKKEKSEREKKKKLMSN